MYILSLAGLAHLCEFIEDCEHTVLATKILHLLGKEGPRTPTPSKYIRFIYNRVILENAAVRAGTHSDCVMKFTQIQTSWLEIQVSFWAWNLINIFISKFCYSRISDFFHMYSDCVPDLSGGSEYGLINLYNDWWIQDIQHL